MFSTIFLATPVMGFGSVSAASGRGNRSLRRGIFRDRLHRSNSRRLPPGRRYRRSAAIKQVAKICLPRFVNQLRVGLVTLKQTLDIRRVRAEIFFNKFC